MNSKTSLFNKSIIKSDLKRFWWVAVLESIAVFITCVLPMLYNSYDVYALTADIAYRRFIGVVNISVIWVVIFSVGTAIMLFSYLYSAGSVSCMHGLPLKRKTQYFSHIITGFALLIVPVFVNSFIFCILKFTALNINYIVKFSFLAKWIAQFSLYTFIVFSGTILVCMLTGNAVASLALSSIFALVPLFTLAATDFFLSKNFYGYYSKDLMSYCSYIYITPYELLGAKCLIYFLGGAVCIALGYFLYSKRKLENYGEVLAFNSLKPVFVFLTAVYSGMLGYIYFDALVSLSSKVSIFTMLPFGFIGLIIAYMLAKKAFTLRGIYKPAIVYTLFVAAVFAGVKYDVTGFEKYIPPIEQIESVSVVYPNEVTRTRYYDGEMVSIDEVFEPEFTSAKDIAAVVAYHSSKIANKDAEENMNYDDYDYSVRRSFPIIYTLKDGKKVYRAYTADCESEKALLAPIYESDVYKAYTYPVYDRTVKKINSFSVNYMSVYMGDINGKDEISRVEEALKKDIAALKYDDFTWALRTEGSCPLTLDMDYIKDMTKQDGSKIDIENVRTSNFSEQYNITDKYVNTIKVLEELGFMPELKAEDIAQVGININNYNSVYTGSTAEVYEMPAVAETETEIGYALSSSFNGNYYDYFTDNPEAIAQIVDFSKTAYKNKIKKNERLSFDITFHMKNSENTYYSYVSFGYEDMPQIFHDIINLYYGR